jgi:L-asparaginase
VRIGLLATGGTIMHARDERTGTVRPSLEVEQLVEQANVPTNLQFAHVEEYLRVDSCDLTPDQMLAVATRIGEVLDEERLDGLVITHGSDTLEETSFLCDLIVDVEQPVVFTAAMRPSGDPAADGERNLVAAARVARRPDARGLGVLVVTDDEVHAARWVRKLDSFRPNAFASPGHGPLGAITPTGIQLWHLPQHRVTLPRPAGLSASVPVVQSFSGMTARYLASVVLASQALGLVIEGSGLGNIPVAAIPAVRQAIEAGVIVAVSSRALTGGVHAVYQDNGGAGALRDVGAVLAGSLPTNKARLLVLLVLAVCHDSHSGRELLEETLRVLDGCGPPARRHLPARRRQGKSDGRLTARPVARNDTDA